MDNEQAQKLPSGKKNKLQVPAYLTIKVEYDCVQAEQNKPIQQLILQEYQEKDIKRCENKDQIIAIPLSSSDNSNVNNGDRFYYVDISTELLKIFEGKIFSILIDPMDDNNPVLIVDKIEYSKDLITKLSEQEQPEIPELEIEGFDE